MGIEFHKGHNCWVKDGKIIPNWTPDEVKLPNYVALPRNWYDSFINKKQEKTMDEEQENYIVNQIHETIKSLESSKRCLTLQLASCGHRLYEVMEELNKANNALKGLKENDEEDC